MKFYRNKFFILLMAFAIVVFFGRTISTTPLAARAVVVGVAMDKVDNEYLITLQAVRSLGDGGAVGYLIYEGKGKTISKALVNIEKDSGKLVSMAHCSTILLGEDLIKEEKADYLSSLVIGEHIPELATVAVTEGKAGELLRKHLDQAHLSGSELHSIMLTLEDKLNMQSATVKDIEYKFMNYKGAVVLPVVKCVELKDEDVDHKQEKPEGKYYKFNFDSAYVFDKDTENNLEFDEKQLSFYRMFYGYGKEAQIELQLDEDTTVGISLIKNKRDIKYNMGTDNSYIIDFSLQLQIKITEFIEDNHYYSKKEMKDIKLAHLEKMSKIVEEGIKESFMICADKGIDVFHLYDRFYVRYRNQICSKDKFLPKVIINPDIKFEFI